MMRFSVWIILLLMSIFALEGCQKNNRQVVRTEPGRPAPGTGHDDGSYDIPGKPPLTNQTIGAIFHNDPTMFNDQLQNMLSWIPDGESLSYVAATLDDQAQTSTGVLFKGVVGVNSDGSLKTDAASTYLVIRVFDESTRDGAAPFFLPFEGLNDYYVDASTARLEFKNQQWLIIFDGTYEEKYYYGRVSFANLDPQAPVYAKPQYLGNFQVEICGFFRCDEAPKSY